VQGAVEVPELRTFRSRRVAVAAVWTLIALAALVLWTPYRTIPYLFLVLAIAAWWLGPRLRRTGTALAILVGFLALQFFVPFDVSLVGRPGPPGVVRLIMGLPTHHARAAAERGEIELGGCMVRGNEPRWVLVW
jgi:hypothetical protein